MKNIKINLQKSLEDYTLKTDAELIETLMEFGCGHTEFHTADIERLLKEKNHLLGFMKYLANIIDSEELNEYLEEICEHEWMETENNYTKCMHCNKTK